jgi:soluble P-type ATPase
VDGKLAGALLLEDPIRPEAPRALQALRRRGFRRIHMLTGDHPDVAELVGDALGVDAVFSERTPDEKVSTVRAVKAEGTVVMVGDGTNDAPALALADVGIAMGARGATAASEAADIVLTRDRLGSLAVAVQIAQRTRRIALQSVYVGMGLSVVAMGAAAMGHLAPVAGAVLQEGIDLLVILNALRALGAGRLGRRASVGLGQLSAALKSTHGELRPKVDELSALATRLDLIPKEEATRELRRVDAFLMEHLLPHEQAEQDRVFPEFAMLLPGEDPSTGLIRTHQEIARLTRLYHRYVNQLPEDGPNPDDLRDLRRALYGLYAILTLHFSQEDELYALMGEPTHEAFGQ